MEAVIYLKDADQKQAASLRAWVAEKGFADITEYRDVTPLRGRSGDKELWRLVQDAKQHRFNFVFVISLQQSGLIEPIKALLVICTLKSCGVSLISRAEAWTDLSLPDLSVLVMAFFEHLDSQSDEMSHMSRSGGARAKKKRKPRDDRDPDSS